MLQADEEVGRVAQTTPPVISVAIETFLKALVEGAAATMAEGVVDLAPAHLYECTTLISLSTHTHTHTHTHTPSFMALDPCCRPHR